MKYWLLFLIMFAHGVRAQVLKSNDAKPEAIYVLKYYYAEEPDKIIYKRAYGRIENKDGSFCIVDYDLKNIDKPVFSSCYDSHGMPTQSGDEKDITKIYKDSIRLNFKGKDTTVFINTNEFKDPTALWFWKSMPNVNETITIGGYAKNFITKKIDIVSTAYTYMGTEIINVLGGAKTCYLVKSVPQNGSTGVYDERWFDQKGMLVKHKHVVGKDGVRIAELSKILNR